MGEGSDIQWKWCTGCKSRHHPAEFGKDRTRYDGLAASCLVFRRARHVRRPRTKWKRHGRLVPARDGDRKQARRRVNYLVEQGRITSPNDQPCVDCGHLGDGARHEYDHHMGYAPEHHETVEAVCAPCHHERSRRRGEVWYG